MELTLDSDDQDRIIHLCITNTAVLSQVIRQRIEPRHFSSDIRQKVFKTTVDFFKAYEKAPGIDILSEIESQFMNSPSAVFNFSFNSFPKLTFSRTSKFP